MLPEGTFFQNTVKRTHRKSKNWINVVFCDLGWKRLYAYLHEHAYMHMFVYAFYTRESKSCKEETIISFPFSIFPLFYLLLQGSMLGRFSSKLTTSKFQIKLKNNYNFCQLFEINLLLIKCSITLLPYVEIYIHFQAFTTAYRQAW